MTLTKVSGIFKTSVKILLGLFIVYNIAIFGLIPLGRKIMANLFPPKDPPTLAFGLLDQITFTKKQFVGTNPEYVLNTKNGNLPTDFPKKVLVYKYVPSIKSLEAGKRASANAATLGFDNNMMTSDLKAETYTWENRSNGATLSIPIYSRDVTLNVPLYNRSSELPSGGVDQTRGLDKAEVLLESLNRFSDPLYKNGYQNIYAGKFIGNEISETTLPYEMQIVRIDFYRNIEKYPIYGDNYRDGLISVYVTGATEPESNKNTDVTFPKLNFSERDIDTHSNASYPLIPIDQVWAEVSTGKGVVVDVFPKDGSHFVNYPPQKIDKILINNIWLGYLDSEYSATYLQPIYVLAGNYTSISGAGSIVIYYPAIQGEYYKAAPVQKDQPASLYNVPTPTPTPALVGPTPPIINVTTGTSVKGTSGQERGNVVGQ